MTDDEGRVRTLLQTTGVPPSRLDAGALLADGRRSHRRRRRATVAGAVLAVVAVAVPAAVVLTSRDGRPDQRSSVATNIATTVRVEHRRTALGAPVPCTQTAFEAPGGTSFGRTLLTDRTGRRVVTTTEFYETAHMWADGKRSDLSGISKTVPRAVTTDGVVYGIHIDLPRRSFAYGAGGYRELPTPAGYPHASVVAVNGRGDAVGQIFAPPGPKHEPSDRNGLVIWPADRPDRPRVIVAPDLAPVAILDDGTVLAARDPSRGGNPVRSDALVAVRTDDTRVEIALTGELAGISPRVDGTAVDGDYLFTHYAPTGWPNLRPVRWNLRTGRVEIFDDLFGLTTGNAAGWVSAADRAGADAPAVLVAPDGTARRVSADQHVGWIGPTGADLIGRIGWNGAPLTWRCG